MDSHVLLVLSTLPCVAFVLDPCSSMNQDDRFGYLVAPVIVNAFYGCGADKRGVQLAASGVGAHAPHAGAAVIRLHPASKPLEV